MPLTQEYIRSKAATVNATAYGPAHDTASAGGKYRFLGALLGSSREVFNSFVQAKPAYATWHPDDPGQHQAIVQLGPTRLWEAAIEEPSPAGLGLGFPWDKTFDRGPRGKKRWRRIIDRRRELPQVAIWLQQLRTFQAEYAAAHPNTRRSSQPPRSRSAPTSRPSGSVTGGGPPSHPAPPSARDAAARAADARRRQSLGPAASGGPASAAPSAAPRPPMPASFIPSPAGASLPVRFCLLGKEAGTFNSDMPGVTRQVGHGASMVTAFDIVAQMNAFDSGVFPRRQGDHLLPSLAQLYRQSDWLHLLEAQAVSSGGEILSNEASDYVALIQALVPQVPGEHVFALCFGGTEPSRECLAAMLEGIKLSPDGRVTNAEAIHRRAHPASILQEIGTPDAHFFEFDVGVGRVGVLYLPEHMSQNGGPKAISTAVAYKRPINIFLGLAAAPAPADGGTADPASSAAPAPPATCSPAPPALGAAASSSSSASSAFPAATPTAVSFDPSEASRIEAEMLEAAIAASLAEARPSTPAPAVWMDLTADSPPSAAAPPAPSHSTDVPAGSAFSFAAPPPAPPPASAVAAPPPTRGYTLQRGRRGLPGVVSLRAAGRFITTMHQLLARSRSIAPIRPRSPYTRSRRRHTRGAVHESRTREPYARSGARASVRGGARGGAGA